MGQNAWYHSFVSAMQHPAIHAFWRSMLDVPEWATAYDASWSWLKPGDYYGLHADDAQMRYVSITIHLTRDRKATDGGEFVWCGAEGDGQDTLVESPERPHFYKS